MTDLRTLIACQASHCLSTASLECLLECKSLGEHSKSCFVVRFGKSTYDFNLNTLIGCMNFINFPLEFLFQGTLFKGIPSIRHGHRTM